jgi:hypothetical protein
VGRKVGALGRLVGVCKSALLERERATLEGVFTGSSSEELIIVEKKGSRIFGASGKFDEVNNTVSIFRDTTVEAGEFGVDGIGRLGGG